MRVVAAFPPDSHPPIVYSFAVTSEAKQADAARRLLSFLGGPAARAAFEAQGFTVLGPPRPVN